MKKLFCVLIGAVLFSLLLPLILRAHHLFVIGLNPFLGQAFAVLTLAIGIVLVTVIFKWFKARSALYVPFTPAMLFAMGFLSFMISGILTGLFSHRSTYDFQLKDTYYVVSYFFLAMIVSGFFGLCAAVYDGFPKLSGRLLNNPMGYIHFWISFIAACLLFWRPSDEGMAGMPRRYIDYEGWYSFSQHRIYNGSVSMLAILIVAVQVLFVFNCFYSAFKGKKARVGGSMN